MGKAMTKSQITDHLAGKAGMSKKAAGQFLDDLASLAHKEAKNTFTLPGLGKLVLMNRKARMGRNPQTGEEIYKQLQLGTKELSDDELIRLMVVYPDLIQRPIIEKGDQAVMGRPPENVKAFL